MTCPPDCRFRDWPGWHQHRADGIYVPTIAVPPGFRRALERELAHLRGETMSDDPGSITWDEQVRLAALVHAARNIADLGVRPVRVWRGTAECDEHPGRITEERTLDIAAKPTDSLKCALCAVRTWISPHRKTTWTVIRG